MTIRQTDLTTAILATAELTGAQLSAEAARVMVADLKPYPPDQVLGALHRCRRELRTRLTLADVLSRIDDGRPTPDEAWAMLPFDEDVTVVWTDEMAAAWGLARPLLDAGDKVGARLAFRDAYTRLLAEAREQSKPVRWTATLGHSRQGRIAPIQEAVAKGRLSPDYAQALLADPAHGIRYLPRAERSGIKRLVITGTRFPEKQGEKGKLRGKG